MEGQGLFVELRRLDGPGGPLDAEAEELGGRDVPGTRGAKTAIDFGQGSAAAVTDAL